MRSPSQWPGTARSSISAGRSEIITMSRIFPRPVALAGPLGTAQGPPLAQASRKLLAKGPSALDEQRHVDGLVGHPHLRIMGESAGHPVGDLLRRPALFQSAFHHTAQLRTPGQLGRPRTSSSPSSRGLSVTGPVAVPAPVGGHLSRDRREGAPESRRHLAERLPGHQSPRDLLAFSQ